MDATERERDRRPDRRRGGSASTDAKGGLDVADRVIERPEPRGRRRAGGGISEGCHHQAPVPVGFLIESPAGRDQPRRAARGQQRCVQLLVQNVERPLTNRVDEATGGETRQGLPQRRCTEAVARRGLRNAEAAVRGEQPAENVGLDPLRGQLGKGVGGVDGSMQNQVVEIEGRLEHVLLLHRLDPPSQVRAFEIRLREVGFRQANEIDRHLGEFGDRLARLLAIRIDDRRRLLDRRAERLDDVGMVLGECCNRFEMSQAPAI